MGIAPPPKETPEVIAYQALRLVIGILGLALPIIVPVGAAIAHFPLQSSLSSYYYTNMGDVFVGTLCAIGVFLFSYRGYSDDKGAPGKWACLFAIGTALVPTDPVCPAGCGSPHHFSVHLLFAALLFLTLMYYSGFLFTKSVPGVKPSDEKIVRNRIYIGCAIAMGLSILLIALWIFVLEPRLPGLEPLQPVFWLEAIAIVAFGFSWLTKSEVILPG